MKHFFSIFIALIVLSFFGVKAQAAASPNGFQSPQCTWWCDWRAATQDWDLEFAEYPRHAETWSWNLTNATHYSTPKVGRIMVLGGWNGNSYGHVAMVEKVNSNGSWVVSHSNWSAGTFWMTWQGVTIRQTTFEKVPNSPGKVRMVGGTTQYPLNGFMKKS